MRFADGVEVENDLLEGEVLCPLHVQGACLIEVSNRFRFHALLSNQEKKREREQVIGVMNEEVNVINMTLRHSACIESQRESILQESYT